MLVRSPCRHSRGSWSRSPSPLTTSGTVPQLFLHPTPTDVLLPTQSGRFVKITLSSHDIRYSAATVPAPHPYWCLPVDTVREAIQDRRSPLTTLGTVPQLFMQPTPLFPLQSKANLTLTAVSFLSQLCRAEFHCRYFLILKGSHHWEPVAYGTHLVYKYPFSFSSHSSVEHSLLLSQRWLPEFQFFHKIVLFSATSSLSRRK